LHVDLESSRFGRGVRQPTAIRGHLAVVLKELRRLESSQRLLTHKRQDPNLRAATYRASVNDLRRLEVVGTPAPVLDGVVTTGFGAADVAVAANGSVVYVPGGVGSGGQQTIVSVDRQGRATPLPGLSLDSYRDVRVSPDGARLAL